MARLQNKGFVSRAPATAASVPEIPDFAPQLAQVPGGMETNAAFQRWWDIVKQRVEFNSGDINKRLMKLKAVYDDGFSSLSAEIVHESTVRADEDVALAQDILAVTATVDGLSASLTETATALATAEGYLEARWTIRASAGPIVTGMTIFSASGADTEVSYIAFQADRFQVNTASGGNKEIFSATATEVKLGDVLTVDLSGARMFIGTGNYANADTGFYVDDDGYFSLKDKLYFNATTDVLTLTGNMTILNTTSFGVNYALATTPGGAANALVDQGALATKDNVSWGSEVTSRPTELTDGRISTAINSAGLIVSGVNPGIVVSASGVAGLYLGSDYLGYYNGSAWKTYMDNAGNFYLGGSTGGSLAWDGTTLVITGTVNATNGLFGGVVDIGSGNDRTRIDSGGLAAGYGSSDGYASISAGTDIGGLASFQLFARYTSSSMGAVGEWSARAASFGYDAYSVLTMYGQGAAANITMASNSPSVTLNGLGAAYFEVSAGSGVFSKLDHNGLVFSNDTNIYRSAANTLKTDDAFHATSFHGDGSALTGISGGTTNASLLTSGTLDNARLAFSPGTMATQAASAVAITGGRVESCYSNGFVYDTVGGANLIGFTWNGANVKVWVDGTVQGTIPNP